MGSAGFSDFFAVHDVLAVQDSQGIDDGIGIVVGCETPAPGTGVQGHVSFSSICTLHRGSKVILYLDPVCNFDYGPRWDMDHLNSNIRTILRILWSVLGTFSEHSRNILGTFSEHARKSEVEKKNFS